MSQMNLEHLTIVSNRKTVVLGIKNILYVQMVGRNAEIHVLGGTVYQTRMTLNEIQRKIGEDFIKIHRGCLVSVMAIHDITDKINLNNGEALVYTVRKRKEIIEQLHEKQKNMVLSISERREPKTKEEYHRHYQSFDGMPFAFTDIEMVFNDDRAAIDWIFCYGNEALAKLEKLPLAKLIGNSFGNLFANMDAKWLKTYETATLYGKTLEIMDYSPEIDTYLKVICFPTFPGHCGCILYNLSEIAFVNNSVDSKKAFDLYFRTEN